MEEVRSLVLVQILMNEECLGTDPHLIQRLIWSDLNILDQDGTVTRCGVFLHLSDGFRDRRCQVLDLGFGR